MGRREIHPINNKPHFFKPLLPNFHTNFSIPKSFLKHLDDDDAHEENDDHEKIAMLRDRREKTYWQVKIDDCGFKDGWEEFCINHGLQVGDFLVFQHLGNFVFEVSIFDPSACEREFPKSPLMVEPSSSAHPRRNTSPMHGKEVSLYIEGSRKIEGHKTLRGTFKPREYPYYQTLVKSYWPKSGMLVCMKFARENGLDKESCKMIVVIDPKGQPWKLPLKNYHNKSIWIGRWGPFHVANSLKTGLPVVFELIDFRQNHPIINFYKLS